MRTNTQWELTFMQLPNMSVFAHLPVIFYKNVFVFLDLVVFCKDILSYFKKSYVSVRLQKLIIVFMRKYAHTW